MIFDFEKLYWLNRQFVKQAGPKRVAELSLPFFAKAAWMTEPQPPESPARAWFEKVVELLAPSVDRLEQLPERAASIFAYDAKAALASPDNAEVLGWEKTRAVVEAFCRRVPTEEAMTVEGFKSIVNEVKGETGTKGKELYHPIRLVITGSHSGPEFDKLIPILEEGSGLKLPRHVKSVRERVEEFVKAFAAR